MVSQRPVQNMQHLPRRAKAEGYDTVAVMFLATSKAEAIHAANHLKVLEKLGEKVAGPEIGSFTVLDNCSRISPMQLKGRHTNLKQCILDL